MQQIWENIPAMRFTTDSTCGFRPKGSSMLISGINLLILRKVIPSLLLHTRNSIPLHVLNHSRVGIVGFYCAEIWRMTSFIYEVVVKKWRAPPKTSVLSRTLLNKWAKCFLTSGSVDSQSTATGRCWRRNAVYQPHSLPAQINNN